MKNLFLSVLALLLVTNSSTSAESFLCVADKATGFKFNEVHKNWEQATFNVSDMKYIIRNPSADDTLIGSAKNQAFVGLEVGGKFPIIFCKDDFDSNGLLFCNYNISGEFRMNKNLGRFILYYQVGYVGDAINPGAKEKDNDPGIVIGRCSPM